MHAETTSFTSPTILRLCLLLSLQILPPLFCILSLFQKPSLSSTFLPLSFALRLAATADLNNSAQAGILQGPIVCAWQENEKERDKERKGENREKGALQGSVYMGVCVCKWQIEGEGGERKVYPAFFYLVVA